MGTMDIWYAHLDEDELRAGIKDYEEFVDAVRSGRIEAREGV